MSPPKRHLDSRGWSCRASQTPAGRPTYNCSTPVNRIRSPRVSAPAVPLALERLHTVLHLIESHFGWANVQQQQPVPLLQVFCAEQIPVRYHMQYQPGPPSAGGSHQFITTNTNQLGAAHLDLHPLPSHFPSIHFHAAHLKKGKHKEEKNFRHFKRPGEAN